MNLQSAEPNKWCGTQGMLGETCCNEVADAAQHASTGSIITSSSPAAATSVGDAQSNLFRPVWGRLMKATCDCVIMYHYCTDYWCSNNAVQHQSQMNLCCYIYIWKYMVKCLPLQHYQRFMSWTSAITTPVQHISLWTPTNNIFIVVEHNRECSTYSQQVTANLWSGFSMTDITFTSEIFLDSYFNKFQVKDLAVLE